jgi:hypothetical protein
MLHGMYLKIIRILLYALPRCQLHNNSAQFVALGFVSNITVLRPLCLSTKSSRRLIGGMKVDIHVLLPSTIKGDEKSFFCVRCKVSRYQLD